MKNFQFVVKWERKFWIVLKQTNSSGRFVFLIVCENNWGNCLIIIIKCLPDWWVIMNLYILWSLTTCINLCANILPCHYKNLAGIFSHCLPQISPIVSICSILSLLTKIDDHLVLMSVISCLCVLAFLKVVRILILTVQNIFSILYKNHIFQALGIFLFVFN